ncbi:unnamed protein product (mitochondrion) [Plasmodiophora brassicae]|uniref:Uncharacterized protein n=1 Tax=Plasmodiophora brassicae TaxID=37360 RepID=A0A0G4J6X5_PLABS|nr:hypothetical protein PBRA_003027 [Plasmodiophora brassicae]SPQ95502.1 unnamed protein product [Plasmodiophora brassicae]
MRLGSIAVYRFVGRSEAARIGGRLVDMGAMMSRYWSDIHRLFESGRTWNRKRRRKPAIASSIIMLIIILRWAMQRHMKRSHARQLTRDISVDYLAYVRPSPSNQSHVSDWQQEIHVGDETIEVAGDQDVYGNTKLFTALDRDAFAELHATMQPIDLAEGQYLFKTGDSADQGMFIVVSGVIEIITPDAGKQETTLYELTSGDDICPYSLFSDSSSTHELSARAAHGPARCVLLPRDAFRQFTSAHTMQFDTLVRIIVAQHWRLVTQVLTQFLNLPAMNTVESQGGEQCAFVDITESTLDLALQNDSLHHYEVLDLEQDEILFELGDPVDACYVLLSGELCGTPTTREGTYDSKWKHIITSSSVVGVMSFMTESRRGETVRATKPSRVLHISKDLYDFLLREHPHCVEPLLWAAGRQLSALTASFFSLGLYSTWYRGGTVIRESPSQTESNPSMYLVISGRVRVAYIKSAQQSKRHLGAARKRFFETRNSFDLDTSQIYEDLTNDLTNGVEDMSIGRGETFGESRTFAQEGSDIHHVRAVCERDTELVAISRATLRNIMLQYPSTIVKFTQMMSNRLAHLEMTSRRHQPRTQRNWKTITLVPAGDTPAHEVAAFALNLTAALSDLDSTLLLNSQRLPHLIGRDVLRRIRPQAEMSRLSLWLAQQEESHRFVILETDGGPHISFWDSFCIRQSDCIILVGRQGCRPFASRYELTVLEHAERRRNSHSRFGAQTFSPALFQLHYSLVIIQPDWISIPTHTADWLNKRNVLSWHHVRSCHGEDFRRVARYIAGRTIGLVLSGGGARGLAHLGVMRALEEEGIDVDCVGGTSQGAFMGALYSANNKDLSIIEPRVRQFAYRFTRYEFCKAVTFPILSFFNGYSFSRAVSDAFGESVQIEDLWLPFFSVATNIGRSNSMPMRRGPLWKLVRASMSLMGLLPPVIYHGDVLVDGGYTNNLPVDVMNAVYSPMAVIAVDVEDRNNSALIGLHDYGPGVSGWWILVQKLNPFSDSKIPQLYDILVWLNSINHNRQLRMLDSELIDIYIRPDINHFGLMQYDQIEQIVHSGYVAAKQAIHRWKAETAEAELESWHLGSSQNQPSLISKSMSLNFPESRPRSLRLPLMRVGSLPNGIVYPAASS